MYFKTSHVIVYLIKTFIECPFCGFQNISCYCLSLPVRSGDVPSKDISKHLMLLFIKTLSPILCGSCDFKTSHVIVYPNCPQGKAAFTIFQNISCYCLSHAFPRFLVSPLLFFPYIFYISPFFTSQHPYPGTPYLSSHKSLNFSSFPGFFILFPPGKNPIIISLNFLLLPPLHFPKLLLQTHCHSST